MSPHQVNKSNAPIVVARNEVETQTIIQTFPGADFIFYFSIQDAQVRAQGRDLIIEFSDGYIIYLIDALETARPNSIITSEGTHLRLDALLADLYDNEETLPLQNYIETDLEEATAEQQTIEGVDALQALNSNSSQVFSSGLQEFKSDSGYLVGSISSLGDKKAENWLGPRTPAQSEALTPGTPSPTPTAPPVPTVKATYHVFSDYIASRYVPEGHAEGLRIDINFTVNPHSGNNSFSMGFGGTAYAKMGTNPAIDTILPWADWIITFSNGTTDVGMNIMQQQMDGSFLFDLPAGTTHFSITVPLYNNDISDGTRNFTYEILDHSGYVLVSPRVDTINIVDESQIQELIPGWVPPNPGMVLPPNYLGPHDGPLLSISIDGTANRNNSVGENDQTVTYKLALQDIASGNNYTTLEPIVVTLKITPMNGMIIDSLGTLCDVNFDFSNLPGTPTLVDGGDGFYYVTFTLLTGHSCIGLSFTATSVGDYNKEHVAGKPEYFKIDIIKTEGNECVYGTGVTTTIQDTPIVSVNINSTDIVESANISGQSNEATFTFKMSAPPIDGGTLDITLLWQGIGSDNLISGNDVTIYIDGVAQPAGTAFPSTITFGADGRPVTIKVVSVDDTLSENIEKIQVTVQAEGGSHNDTDTYYVDTSNSSASLTLHDDTSTGTWAENGKYLDGPTISFVRLDQFGQPILVNGKVPESTILAEMGPTSPFDFVLGVLDSNHSLATAQEDVLVTFSLEFHSAKTNVVFDSTGPTTNDPTGAWDVWIALPEIIGQTVNYIQRIDDVNGKLTYQTTIPSGSNSITIKATTNQDAVNEDLAKEGFKLTILETNGHESKAGGSLDVGISDTPIIGFAPNPTSTYISESTTTPEQTYTIDTSKTFATDQYVFIQVASSANLATLGSDFTLGVGCIATGTPGLFMVKIPAGQSNAEFKLNIIDDLLSEENEVIHMVIVQPNGTINPDASDTYIRNPNTSDSFSLIVDDTNGWPTVKPANPFPHNPPVAPGDHGQTPQHPYQDDYANLEGPRVKLVIDTTKNGSDTTTTVNGNTASIMEHNGIITYKLQITNPNGNGVAYNADEEITVTINAADFASSGFYFTDMAFAGLNLPAGASLTYNNATGAITIIVPKGTSSISFTGTPTADALNENNDQFTLTIDHVSGNESRVDTSANKVTTTITDPPVATVTVDNASIFESPTADNNAGTSGADLPIESTFTFTLDQASLTSTTIALNWAMGTGTTVDDYSWWVNGVKQSGALPTSVTFPKGSTEYKITIKPVDDKLSESAETVTVTIKAADGSGTMLNTDGYRVGGTNDATLTIVDDTHAGANNPHLEGPRVKLEIASALHGEKTGTTSATVMENNGEVTYSLKVVGLLAETAYNPNENITVTLKVTGLGGLTATDIENFLSVSGGTNFSYTPGNPGTITVIIPSGTQQISFKIKSQADTNSESSEGLTLSIASVVGNEASVHTNNEVTTYFTDTPAVSVSCANGNQADTMFESAGNNTPGMSNENSFTFNLSTSSYDDVTVKLDWTVANSATVGSDFKWQYSTDPATTWRTGPLPTEITFNAGQDTLKINVQAIDDSITESNEYIKVTIKSESGTETFNATDSYQRNPGQKDATVTLHDDTHVGGNTYLDGPTALLVYCDSSGNILYDNGNPKMPISSASVRENIDGGNANFDDVHYKVILVQTNADGSLLRNGDGTYTQATSQGPVSVTIAVTGNSSTTLTGSNAGDYGFKAGTNVGWNPSTGKLVITIPSGQNSTKFTGGPIGDATPETGEGVDMKISEVNGNETRFDSGTTLTTHIDDAPTIGISADATHYSETSGQMLFHITLSADVTKDITVKLVWTNTANNTTAHLGTDFGEAGSTTKYTTVTIPAGTKATDGFNFSVPIIQDDLTENIENVTVTLGADSGVVGGRTYHVDADPAKNTANTKIVDNTTEWDNGWGTEPGDHGSVNGPMVVIFAGSGNYNKSDNLRYQEFHGSAEKGSIYTGHDREAVVLETEGNSTITYHVKLFDQNGLAEYDVETRQDIVVELAIEPVATTIMIETAPGVFTETTYFSEYGKDYSFDLPIGAVYVPSGNSDGKGTIKFTLPAGFNPATDEFVFNTIIYQDSFTEVGRQVYDLSGKLINTIKDEGFTITVAKVEGNEATTDKSSGSENLSTIVTTIDEDHEGQLVSIGVQNGNAIEGNDAEFFLFVSRTTEEDIIVVLRPVQLAGDNSAALDIDFQGASFRIVIPAGTAASGRIAVPISTFNDILGEGLENFKLQVIDVIGSEAKVNPNQNEVQGTIRDDMDGPKVGFIANECTQKINESEYESAGDAGAGIVTSGYATYTIGFTSPDPVGKATNNTPIEDVFITIKVTGAGGADPQADINWDNFASELGLPTGVELISFDKTTGTFIVKVPEGFTGLPTPDSHKFSFTLKINDDQLSEEQESYELNIIRVGNDPARTDGKGGSEAVIDPSRNNVSTTIIDDDTKADENTNDTNIILDGPYLKLGGPVYVSESSYTPDENNVLQQGLVYYTIELKDPITGDPYTSLEAITVTISYTQKLIGGEAGTGALPGSDFETIHLQITIPQGVTEFKFPVRIADDNISELNEMYTVTIGNPEGNEARIDTGKYPVSADTIIVDDSQPWLPEYGNEYKYGKEISPGVREEHTATGGGLEGPKVTLHSDESSVYEYAGTLNYTVLLDSTPSQPIIVTMKITLTSDNIQLEDLFDPALIVQGDDATTLANIKAALNTAGMNNGRIETVSFDTDGNVLLTFTTKNSSTPIKLPVYNDDLESLQKTDANGDPILDPKQWKNMDTNAKFTVSIDKVTNAEARLEDNTSKDVTITEGNFTGPNYHVTARDGATWVREADIVGNVNNPQYESNPNVYFKFEGSKNAAEPITITFYLSTMDGNANPLDFVPVLDQSYIDDGYTLTRQELTINGKEYNTYMLTIPEGKQDCEIGFPKIPEDDANSNGNHTDDGYKGQHYKLSIYDVAGSESYVNSGSDYAIARVVPDTGSAPWTYGQLYGIDDSGNLVHYNANINGSLDFVAKEGQNASFWVRIVAGSEGSPHDTDVDGFTDSPITITLQITALNGMNRSDGANGDLDWAAFNVANPQFPAGTTYNYDSATGKLSVTIPAGMKLSTSASVGDKDSGAGIVINMPVKDDSVLDLNESFEVSLVGVSGGYAYQNGVGVYIEDSTGAPEIELFYKGGGTTGSVEEGVNATFELVLDSPPIASFTVYLGYEGDRINANTATEGMDFIPLPTSITIPTTGWVLGVDGKYHYDFSVMVPDDKLSEGNETFTVKITDVSNTVIVTLGTNTSVEATITESTFTGPRVYFQSPTDLVAENASALSYEVVLDSPTEEDVIATIEILFTGCDRADFADVLDTSKIPGYRAGTGADAGRHFIDITFLYDDANPEIQKTLKLNNALKDDQLKEIDEYFELKIVGVKGGEVTIDANRDTMKIDLVDTPSGPLVSVTASRSQIHENPNETNAGDLTSDTVSFTFAIPVAAHQAIDLVFTVKSLNGTLDGLFDTIGTAVIIGGPSHGQTTILTLVDSGNGYQTIKVILPEGATSITWTPPKLKNDILDEQGSRAEKFQVEIISVDGHESGIGTASVIVNVVDDDYMPVTKEDNVVILIEAKSGRDGIATGVDVLQNDTDADNDPLSTIGVSSKTGAFGTWGIDENGKLTYLVDHSKQALTMLNEGQMLTELPAFTYTVKDVVAGDPTPSNEVAGKVNLVIAAMEKYTGTANDQWVYGSGRAEWIDGGGGNDTIYAGGGDDTIINRNNTSLLDGGTGNDMFLFNPISGKVELAHASSINGGDGVDMLGINANGAHFNFTGTGWEAALAMLKALTLAVTHKTPAITPSPLLEKL